MVRAADCSRAHVGSGCPRAAQEQPRAASCGLQAKEFSGRLLHALHCRATGNSNRVWVRGIAHEQLKAADCGLRSAGRCDTAGAQGCTRGTTALSG